MDEKQLKLLYDKYGSKVGEMSFQDFSNLLSLPKNRELFFNEVKPSEYKTFDDFNNIFSVKQEVKQPVVNAPAKPEPPAVDLAAYQQREIAKQGGIKAVQENNKKLEKKVPDEEYGVLQLEKDDILGLANKQILNNFVKPVDTKVTSEVMATPQMPIEVFKDIQRRSNVGKGKPNWEQVDALKEYAKRIVVGNADNAGYELQKLTSKDISTLSDEEIIGLGSMSNETHKAYKDAYLKQRKIQDVISNSMTLEDAAIRYEAKMNPESKARFEKLMSYGGSFSYNIPQVVRGEAILKFLTDDDVVHELNKNAETAKYYREQLNNLYNNYPDLGKLIVGMKITDRRERDGLNNGVVNVVEKVETDAQVAKMVEDGELTLQEKRIYEEQIRPRLGLGNFGRAILSKEDIKTPGFLENTLSGFTQGVLAQGQGIAEFTGIRDTYKADAEQLYTDLEKQYKKNNYQFSGVHKYTQIGGDITGQALAIGFGGKNVSKLVKPTGTVGIRVAGGLQAYGNYMPQARLEFPDDPVKQKAYALVMSGLEMATEGIFDDTKAIRALTGEVKSDFVKMVNKFTDKEITAEAAIQEVQGIMKKKLTTYIGKYGKEVFKGNTENAAEEVIASIGQNVLTDVFKGRPIDEEKLNEDIFETAVTSWLGSSVLSGLGARARMREMSVESRAIYEVAKNPEPYKAAIVKNSYQDEALAAEAQEKLENIDFAVSVLDDIKDKGWDEKKEERYLIQSLNAEVLRKKAANTSDEIVQNEIKSEINETVKEREAILKEDEEVQDYKPDPIENVIADTDDELPFGGTMTSNEYFNIEPPKTIREQFDELEGVVTDPYDLALMYFAGGGKINTSVIESIFGGRDSRIRQSTSIEGERRAKIGLMKKDGRGLDELAHDLWENQPEELRDRYTTLDFRNAIEEALLSYNSASAMMKSVVERYNVKDSRTQFTQEEWDEIEERMLQNISNQLVDLPEAQAEEIINFLGKYQDQYGEINWSKLEADTQGFNGDFLSLSQEAQNYLYEKVEGQGEYSDAGTQTELSQEEKVAEAQRRYNTSQERLKAAEDEISQKQATQGDMFSGAQTEMFGVNRQEAKAILDPLREEVRLAKQELDKLNFEAEIDQPELFNTQNNEQEAQNVSQTSTSGIQTDTARGTDIGADTGTSRGTQRQNGDTRGSGGTGRYTQSDFERDLGDILKLETQVAGNVSLVDLGITPATPFAEIIDKMAAYDGQYKPLLERIKAIGGFENIKVREATPEELAKEGGFQAAYIRINDNPTGNPENKGTLLINPATENQYYALTHEIMHWVTLDAENIDRVANQDKLTKLNDIYNILTKNLGGFKGTMESYGLKNFREFLAELLINPNFREYVQGVIIENKSQFDANVEWASGSSSFLDTIRDFFVDLINKILGRQGDIEFNKPLVESAVKIATDVFFDGQPVVYEQMTKYPNVKLQDMDGNLDKLPEQDKTDKIIEAVKKALANGLNQDAIAQSLMNKGLSFTEVQEIIAKSRSAEFEKEAGKKSVLNRAYEGQTKDDIKKAIFNNDLNYDIENQLEAETRARSFIAEVGIDNALAAVENGQVRGAAAAQIYADAINYYNDKAIESDSLEDSERATEIQMGLLRSFDETSRESGRFISMLQRIYETSDFAFNAELQINQYKARAGEISPEVEQKFRDLEAQYNELKVKLADAERRAKEAEEQQAILDIQDSVARETKNPKQTAKDLANKIRKAKLSRPGMFSAATPASLVWDAAVEVVAKTVETGGTLADAIQKGVRYIKQTSWYRNLNTDDQNKAVAEFEKSLAEDQIPQPFITDKGRIVVPERFIRDAVKNGVKTIDELVAKVQEVLPESSEREIRDSITKYGKTVNLSKDEIDAQIRKIKRVGKIVSQLEDVSEGKRPLRSGLQRDKPDVEERELMKQLAKEMEGLPLDEETEARELKTALDAIKTRLSNQIEDIQREIETGQRQAKSTGVPYDQEAKDLAAQRDALKKIRDELIKDDPLELQAKKIDRTIKALDRAIEKTKQKIATKDIDIKAPEKASTPEIEARRSELNSLKDELNKLRDEAGITDKRKIEAMKNRLRAQIQDYETRLKNGDFAKKKKPPVFAETELANLRAKKETIRDEFAREQYRAELKAMPDWRKWLHRIIDTSNITRTLRATFEFSFILIQGGPYSIAHPINAIKAVGNMLISMISSKRHERFEEKIKGQEWYQRAKASKLALTEPDHRLTLREEAFMTGWASTFLTKFFKIFGINPLGAVERANVAFMNSIRIFRYLQGEELLKRKGKTFTDNQKDFEAVAKTINTMTGRASLGKLEMATQELSLVFFSPRNWATQIKLATPVFFYWMYKSRTPGERISVAQKMVVLDLMKYYGLTISGVLAAAAYLNNDDDEETGVSFDFTSSDALKIKLGETRIDPFGGKLQYLTMFTRIFRNEYTTAGGKKSKLGQTAFTPTEADLLIRSITNKLSPSARMIWDRFSLKMKDGKYYKPFDDEEYSVGNSIKENLYPIFWDTIGEIQKDNPDEVGFFLIVLAGLGMNVSVYESKEKKGLTAEELEKMR